MLLLATMLKTFSKVLFPGMRMGWIVAEEPVDIVFAAGPVVMMQAVAEVTRPRGIKTIASLNPIMVDGTGMCGGCRVSVGGQTKFACVDGPEFDGHQVDYDELMLRLQAYCEDEKKCYEEFCIMDS